MENMHIPIGMMVDGEDPLALLHKVKSMGISTCQLCVLPIAISPEKQGEHRRGAKAIYGIRSLPKKEKLKTRPRGGGEVSWPLAGT